MLIKTFSLSLFSSLTILQQKFFHTNLLSLFVGATIIITPVISSSPDEGSLRKVGSFSSQVSISGSSSSLNRDIDLSEVISDDSDEESEDTSESFGISGSNNARKLYSKRPKAPSFKKLPKPVAVSFDVQASTSTSAASQAEQREVNLTPLHVLSKTYQIPIKELNRAAPKLKAVTKHHPAWQACVKGASSLDNDYIINPSAFAFTAIEGAGEGEHDYYDISLDLMLNTPDTLKAYHFLPKAFIIQAQPIHYTIYKHQDGKRKTRRKWEVVSAKECPLLVWEHCPEAIIGKTEATSTKSHTYTATAMATASGNAGGGSGSVTAMAAASYTSTFSFKRDIPDMYIQPFRQDNEVRWEIDFNNLRTDPTKGCCSDGIRNIRPLRWIWKVNRETAIDKLYTSRTPEARDTFYFKINLFAQFARMTKSGERRKTAFLPIFNNQNGEASQIFSLSIPDATNKYQITNKTTFLGKEIRK